MITEFSILCSVLLRYVGHVFSGALLVSVDMFSDRIVP